MLQHGARERLNLRHERTLPAQRMPGRARGLDAAANGQELHPSTPFPALMARNLGLLLFAGRIVREPGVRFRLSVERIEVPVTDDKEADILAATANLQAAFERSIREKPEQWMWAHQRWG